LFNVSDNLYISTQQTTERVDGNIPLTGFIGNGSSTFCIQIRGKLDDIASITLQVAWMLFAFRKLYRPSALSISTAHIEYDGLQGAFEHEVNGEVPATFSRSSYRILNALKKI
jgi:hypothetical protein